ncbi:tyrosine-protein phosphatase [Salirhabdus salicampi]|uniref:tyrosine-protein phosphatase n=1 Tax=Salirhabdus salicampi TaxID=476102 RepID=UPI0020C42F70|nr:CpsB/CapC family capsule biosynthesis tyrosine phosphatase [Salirhabdus salicampi]MCP8617513.1 tyrosine protein phosphatase [Salirhabdus salicampi]
MIDIHCHIIPKVDDGPSSVTESLKMAKLAVEEGIHTIVATPHHLDGQYINNRDVIVPAVQSLNEALQAEQIPLKVLPGQEPRVNGDMLARLEKGELIPLNGTKYVFVEFPHGHVPRYANQLLFDVQVAGYKPIIVHPERNSALVQSPDLLYSFVKNGALTQVTAASVCGKFGKKIQKFTLDVIDNNLTHFVASDAHNTKSRLFHMREAYDVIEKRFGNQMVYEFTENAELLIEGNVIVGDQPHRLKKKKFLGLI